MPNDAPELIPRLQYTKNWENPADYATRQNNEVQNRKDIQSLFAEIATYINNVMLPRAEQLISEGGGGGGGGASGDFLPLDGGTMRGVLRLCRNPEFNAEAATKQYVDGVAGSVAADADADITAVRQTAEALELLAQSHDGQISSLTVRADEISSAVQNLDGEISTLSQTAGAIETRVTNAEGGLSAIAQTVNGITLSVSTVTENGEVFARLTLRIGEQELYGYIKLEGNADISGQLSAEALYAGYGEVANLTVDAFNTSRRIVRYLAGDASDDNFIRARGQSLEWVTARRTGGTEQAKNPDGAPLYWPVNVSGLSRGADGYPVTGQGERVFTTTAPTEYPVQVYAYAEEVKRGISFEPVNGIYSPIDRFGAGNASGNNRAWILKTADGFDIRYLTPDNVEIGIRMTADGKLIADGLEYDADKIRALLGLSGGGGWLDLTRINADGSASGLVVDADGYADLKGLRKVTALDFSNIETSGFSETLDGGIYNAYRVTRDASGRISSVVDAAGHETVVTWGA
ncbi:MAG: hypothetical protein IKN96_03460 [Oscillibacter sp.]|nr:hypothetical protein [Oscillibacter sp.]